jgi:hypothetical protein
VCDNPNRPTRTSRRGDPGRRRPRPGIGAWVSATLPLRHHDRVANRVVGGQQRHRVPVFAGCQITGQQPRHQTGLDPTTRPSNRPRPSPGRSPHPRAGNPTGRDSSNQPAMTAYPPPAQHAGRQQQHSHSSPGHHHVDHLRAERPIGFSIAAGRPRWQATAHIPRRPAIQPPHTRSPPISSPRTTDAINELPHRYWASRPGPRPARPSRTFTCGRDAGADLEERVPVVSSVGGNRRTPGRAWSARDQPPACWAREWVTTVDLRFCVCPTSAWPTRWRP